MLEGERKLGSGGSGSAPLPYEFCQLRQLVLEPNMRRVRMLNSSPMARTRPLIDMHVPLAHVL